KQYPSRLVVITGGEPLMYDLTELTYELKQHKFTVNIETSGAYPLSGELDWICFSPKKFKAPLPEIYEQAHELKIIIYNKSDFRWAEQFVEKINPQCQLFLQPEWSVAEKMLPQMIEYVKQNPQWRISLQTHKFLHIP
ncbi:MAG: 7-carboxy-7-deazaguanine synthase QueE, partial [Tunicatimonas sp.]|uniref:7-carboxy-7-deazaguanine synthase QueE n=1 Tax=Tunicatimonas sp. TaxID=1940096 RepID=UPI003C707E02